MGKTNLDEMIDGTIVSFLEIKMRRDGVMSIGGTITDEQSVLAMLDTARATMVGHFKQNREGKIIVPAHDTALVGTDMEKRLLQAREKLHIAADEVKPDARRIS